jgi:hypothetical protein
LFQALKNGCHGLFGILSTFAHWQANFEESVTVGRINTVNIRLPEGVVLFAAFLAPQGGPEVQYIAKVWGGIGGSELWILTSEIGHTSPVGLGTRTPLDVGVYGYQADSAAGWARLLYDSLADLSEQRYAMAVFKLATSVEILCERTFEKYLEGKTISAPVIRKLLRSGRSWDSKFGRIQELAPPYLDSDELVEFQAAGNEFRTVRELRNSFAHDAPQAPAHADATNSFQVAFSLIWAMDRINGSLVS